MYLCWYDAARMSKSHKMCESPRRCDGQRFVRLNSWFQSSTVSSELLPAVTMNSWFNIALFRLRICSLKLGNNLSTQ
jgi:hypothetical protein